MTIILTLDKILTRHTANAMMMLNNKECCTGEKARKFTHPLAQLEGLISTVQGASDSLHTSKLAKCAPTIHSSASKKGKRKTSKEETKGRGQEETEREREL